MSNYRQIWGARIKAARRAAGYSQTSLAEAVNVQQTDVSRWESGQTAPRDDRRPTIAELLGLDVAQLFAFTPDEEDEGDPEVAA